MPNAFDKKLSRQRDIMAINNSSCITTVLKISDIDENPRNEFIFNMRGIENLAEFIKKEGFYQPIVVFQKDDGRYEIIAGHRKFRAKKLNGDKTIDAIIKKKPASEGEKAYQIIFDNINARVLTPLDMARAMEEIKNTWIPEQKEKGELSGDTKDILANLFNISSSKVSRTLRLLNLSRELQDKVDQDILAVDAALVLLQDDNLHLDGLQDFVNTLIDEQMKTEGDKLSITKTTVMKMVSNFKLEHEKDENGSDKPPKVVTKKKFMKVANSFHQIFSYEKDDEFILEDKELETLQKLKEEIDLLIQKHS